MKSALASEADADSLVRRLTPEWQPQLCELSEPKQDRQSNGPEVSGDDALKSQTPYDGFGRVIETDGFENGTNSFWATIANDPNRYLMHNWFTYSPNSDVIGIAERFGNGVPYASLTVFNQTYAYDNVDRLTGVADPGYGPSATISGAICG